MPSPALYLGRCIRWTNRPTQPVLRVLHRPLSTQTHEPLRILFCGSDEISIATLRALDLLRNVNPGLIESIDVLCRPMKGAGRGRKLFLPVPVQSFAETRQLTVHTVDDFTGWQGPEPGGYPVNMIITASFGLLVPARILGGAKFGGLNVHPSLLPDLRGAAPLHHALLRRRTHTGVSIQTMHPTRFDAGRVLLQTPRPGIKIPDDCTVDRLRSLVIPQCTRLLTEVLRDGLFMNPPPQPDTPGTPIEAADIAKAPKCTTEDRHIDWASWTADELLLRTRVFDDLWDLETYARCTGSAAQRRVIFTGLKLVHDLGPTGRPAGVPVLVAEPEKSEMRLDFGTCDGRRVTPRFATIEGSRKQRGLPRLVGALLRRTEKMDGSVGG